MKVCVIRDSLSNEKFILCTKKVKTFKEGAFININIHDKHYWPERWSIMYKTFTKFENYQSIIALSGLGGIVT